MARPVLLHWCTAATASGEWAKGGGGGRRIWIWIWGLILRLTGRAQWRPTTLPISRPCHVMHPQVLDGPFPPVPSGGAGPRRRGVTPRGSRRASLELTWTLSPACHSPQHLPWLSPSAGQEDGCPMRPPPPLSPPHCHTFGGSTWPCRAHTEVRCRASATPPVPALSASLCAHPHDHVPACAYACCAHAHPHYGYSITCTCPHPRYPAGAASHNDCNTHMCACIVHTPDTRWRAFWAIFGEFWAVSWTYRGVRWQERAPCHGAIMAHVKCSSRFPSFGRLEWVLGPFWAKNGWSGHRAHTKEWCGRRLHAPFSLKWAKGSGTTLKWARARVRRRVGGWCVSLGGP